MILPRQGVTSQHVAEVTSVHTRPRRRRELDPQALEAERSRIFELCKEVNARFNADDESGITLAAEAMRRARAIDDPVSIARASIVMSDFRMLRGESDVAVRLLERAIVEMDRSPDDNTCALLHRRLGDARRVKGRLPEALESYSISLTIAEAMGRKDHIARGLASMATTYRVMAEYPKALELMKRSQAIFQEIGDKVGLESTEMNLGNIYMSLSEWERAEELYLRGLDRALREGQIRDQANLLGNLGSLYSRQKDFSRGLKPMKSALVLFRKVGDRQGEGNTLFNIGCNYRDSGHYRKALPFMTDALEIFKSLTHAQLVAEATFDRGKLYVLLGEVEEGLHDMLAALDMAHEARHASIESEACATIADVYESLGRTEAALEYYKRHMDLQRRIAGYEVGMAIATLELEERMDLTSKELASSRKRAEELADEIAARAQENAAMALHLTQNERFVGQLHDAVTTLAAGSTKDRKEAAATILARLREARSGEAQWAQFERQFIRLHPEFLLTLRRLHPSLTLTEQRVCALLRLGMASKEIASVLCGSVRTIEGHRHRIRKKLGLDTGAQLINTISSI